MKKVLNVNEMSELQAGDVRSFCAGWIGGVAVGLSFGWVAGPAVIAAVVIGSAVCLASDSYSH